MLPNAGDVQRYEAAAAVAARRILDSVAASAAELDVACDTRHIIGELPAEGILKAAREAGCDLIVMASHGRRGVERLLLGSQAMKVMAASTVPVLICR
jgi:nucleotide-binding universal stress UspA family protein